LNGYYREWPLHQTNSSKRITPDSTTELLNKEWNLPRLMLLDTRKRFEMKALFSSNELPLPKIDKKPKEKQLGSADMLYQATPLKKENQPNPKKLSMSHMRVYD